MELTDIAPLEEWVQIEKEAFEKFNLQSSVFNTEGVRISGTKCWANKICPEIKSTDKGQTFICATAHMNMANQSKNEKAPVIEECDAGLFKIVVPIFFNDEFLGTAGGCGLVLEDGEVDSFAINKITDIDEDKIEKLSEKIPSITDETAETVGNFFIDKIHELVQKYQASVSSKVSN